MTMLPPTSHAAPLSLIAIFLTLALGTSPTNAQAILRVGPDQWSALDRSGPSPLRLSEGIERVQKLVRNGLPEGGVVIELDGGRYEFETPLILDASLTGTADSPIRIRAAAGAQVIFDGARKVEATRFKPVSNPEERTRLSQRAAQFIVAQTIEDPKVIHRLKHALVLGLIINGETYFPARFPNQGYAQLHPRAVTPEVSPPAVPVGKEAYGVRAGHPPYQAVGKKQGWLGTLVDPKGAHARFAARQDEMAGTWAQWEAELARENRRNMLTGFLDANWLQKSQPIVSASAETQSIHLSQALAYGWAWKNRDKPFQVFGMLCELDAPGEWHFDPKTRRLYLYPPEPLTEATEIRVPIAPGFAVLKDAAHLSIEGVMIENVASGTVIRIEGGRQNSVLGCTIKNSSACGIRVSGQDHTVSGCDLYDLDHHVALGGGQRGPGILEAGNNRVENCHIYQHRFKHRKVGVSVSGVGQSLLHNLIHNSLGQAVTVNGNDHLIEFNELFNIGFDEGDGGAIYAGGDLTGYGVTYRHNFFHHLMHVKGKVERSGIHLDDLQAGSSCIGNIFYKSAGKGIFMNGGAGHHITGNVFLEGFRGVYNVGHGAQKNHDRQAAILKDPRHDYRNTKENYVGRAERIVGPSGWNQEPWKSRYPLFQKVMNDTASFGRLWPIRCHVLNNLYCGNQRGDRTIWSRVAKEARAKSVIADDRAITGELFMNFETLDLRFAPSAKNVHPIPFESIGLRIDQHRRSMPSKSYYRRAIKLFFEGVGCMSGTPLRIDTAALINEAPQMTR